MRRPVKMLIALALLAVLGFAAAGCGSGGGNKSFTVKLDVFGKTAYLAVTVPSAHATAIKEAYTRYVRSDNRSMVVNASPQGPLDCSKSGKIEQNHLPAAGFVPYDGDSVTVKVYGSGLVPDDICHQIQQNGL
jgi:hypothetical protein